MVRLILRSGLVASLAFVFGPASGQDMSVAGVDPSTRPTGAPEITNVDKDSAWYANALRGVVPPYPYSLKFLEDQGNWFNPFQKPGMTGPYDIRGWH